MLVRTFLLERLDYLIHTIYEIKVITRIIQASNPSFNVLSNFLEDGAEKSFGRKLVARKEKTAKTHRHSTLHVEIRKP